MCLAAEFFPPVFICRTLIMQAEFEFAITSNIQAKNVESIA